MNVGLWEAKGHVWKLEVFFSSAPQTENRYYQNTAINAGNYKVIWHQELHAACTGPHK